MNKLTACFLIAMLAANASFAQKVNQEVPTVSSVDIVRYAGKWYEIARFSNRFQDQCAANVTAEYEVRSDGLIGVTNRCRKIDAENTEVSGIARVVDIKSNAKLKVSFAPAWLSWLPIVWGDYWVIGLADDYTYAVVGEPSRKYLWVLSRAPTLNEATYKAALSDAARAGYDTSKLVKTEQKMY